MSEDFISTITHKKNKTANDKTVTKTQEIYIKIAASHSMYLLIINCWNATIGA